MNRLQDVFAHIDAHLDETLGLLARLIAQPSISAQGVGMADMARLVAETFRAYGLEPTTFPVGNGSPIVYAARAGASPRTVLFYDHYDVQPPDPLELWTTPPFELRRVDGKLCGRGVADNKGNLVARLAAIRAWREVRGELPVTVKFCVEGEEEVGSPNLTPFVESHRDLLGADGCIWEFGGVNWQGNPLIILGLKGMLYVDLIASGAARDVHSAMATYVPNPAWRLVWALSTLKDQQERVQIAGFYDDVRPPTPEELAAVASLPDETEDLKRAHGLDRFLLGAEGAELERRQIFEPTCNIAGLISGYTGPGGKTVLPCVARAKVDLRLVPDQRPADILEKLHRHLKRHGFGDLVVEPEWGALYPARTPLDAPFVDVVRRAAELAYSEPPLVIPSSAGSGPMHCFTGMLGLPTASSGAGYPDSRTHAPNENIRLADFVAAARHAAAMLGCLAE